MKYLPDANAMTGEAFVTHASVTIGFLDDFLGAILERRYAEAPQGIQEFRTRQSRYASGPPLGLEPNFSANQDQSSSFNPGSRLKSRKLRVTRVTPFRLAIAAILRSLLPMRYLPLRNA